MRFWDSSAIVPILLIEVGTDWAVQLQNDDPEMLVWWATPLECISAIARRRREGLESPNIEAALIALSALRASWIEAGPSEGIRTVASSLLQRHALRAADALQLAAALEARREYQRVALEFVCLDNRLLSAAGAEGLLVSTLPR